MDLSALLGATGPLRAAMSKAEADQAQTIVEGSAGGGAVRLRLRGDLTVERLTIAPAAVSAVADDPSMLEDLVAAALNDGLANWRRRFGGSTEERLQKLMAGADLGALSGLLGGLGR